MKQSGAKKTAIQTVSFMMLATLLSKVMGLVRDMLFARAYGTSYEANAFIYASKVPVTFFDIALGAAVLSTFIPVFNKLLQQDKEKAHLFASRFITLVTLLAVAFCVVASVLASPIIKYIIAPGITDSAVFELTRNLLVILLPTTLLTVLVYCAVGILQSFGEFNIPAIISLVSNGVVIIYLLAFNKTLGVYGMAGATLIGWVMQLAIQLPFLRKTGYSFKPSLRLNDPHIKEAYRLAVPILISTWITPICMLVNTRFASYIDGGRGAAALDYANRLYLIIVVVFTYTITNYIFPRLSKMSGEGDNTGFAETLRVSLKVMLLIITPLMAGLIMLAEPIITLIYAGNAFDVAAVANTSAALRFYAIGMVSMGAVEIITKSCYATGKATVPMVASISGIAVNTIASFIISRMALPAPVYALASSAGILTVSIILLAYVFRAIKNVVNRDFLLFAVKVIFCAVVMAAAVLAVQSLIKQGTLALILGVAAGAAVYGGTALLFKLHKRIS